MFTNIYYQQNKSLIHLWEIINGKRKHNIVKWSPFVFTNTDEPTDIKTIDGSPVNKVDFSSYSKYKKFTDTNKKCYENQVAPSIQFLSEKYHEIEDDNIDVPDLVVHYEDIEVFSEHEFPSPNDAKYPITVITIVHNNGIQTFGLHPFKNTKNIKNLTYHCCKDEKDLLIQYFNWKHKNMCDVQTGWFYCDDIKAKMRGGFDLPYIINRTKRLFGENTDLYKKLSPINIVKVWEDGTEGFTRVDIAGVTVLDYMSVYKWYTTHNLENNKLDYVAELELNEKKLEYEGSLRDLYQNDWQKYVEYNIQDTVLVKKIDDKCGYISLIQALTLLCRTPMIMYNVTTNLIEGLMLTYYRRNGLCAPRLKGGTQEWYPAAFVKEPKPGLYSWVVDLDITSSYPTTIITLNISNETYFGRIIGFEEKHLSDFRCLSGIHDKDDNTRPFYDIIIKHVKNKKFPPFYLLRDNKIDKIEGEKLTVFNNLVKKRLISIAPCGSIFKNKPRGVIAEVEHMVFNKRKIVKSQYKKLELKAKNLKGKEKRKTLILAKKKYDLQWAFKILINSVYGVMAVPYSRYFNVHMAEAVTSCSRQTILDGQKYVNELLNNPNNELINIIERIKNYK